MLNNNSSSQYSSFQNYRDSTTGSSRIISPIAFFHDGITINDIDLRSNIMGTQRRAQAIATAPRRNRCDDDDDNTKKKILFGFVKTMAIPIPIPSISQQTQSLPKIQSDMNLMSNFHSDSSTDYENYEFDYLYGNNSYPK
ncbi:unnamed protein product [Rotaria sordida]|uniref:Uncharacterized protein n=1 Tax=Rotaria sordida TaxID=392033 RepID=A0A819ESX6_9BILA|nr:unnamed protein product [Rotaria sordida]